MTVPPLGPAQRRFIGMGCPLTRTSVLKKPPPSREISPCGGTGPPPFVILHICVKDVQEGSYRRKLKKFLKKEHEETL